jgi:hypothetical protein
LPDAFGKGGEPRFCFADDLNAPRTSRFCGWYCERIAISSGASRVAVVAVDKNLVRHLVVLKPTTGETETDLTDLVEGFNLEHVEPTPVLLEWCAIGSWLGERVLRALCVNGQVAVRWKGTVPQPVPYRR